MRVFNAKKLKYNVDQIIAHFGLQTSMDCPILEQWLAVEVPADYVLAPALEHKRERLLREGNMWNEEELKMYFLSNVFDHANIEIGSTVKLFYERSLTAVVQDTPLSVICDAFLATSVGFHTPQKPYFFLQEFKKGKYAQDDAEGQMLIAMLVAQALNQDDKIVFGCYLLGKDWHFTSLHNNRYCFSASYDATRPTELAQIIHILAHLKHFIHP